VEFVRQSVAVKWRSKVLYLKGNLIRSFLLQKENQRKDQPSVRLPIPISTIKTSQVLANV